MMTNPYLWNSDSPEVVVPLPLVEVLFRALRSRRCVIVYGGRGMGKSVTLEQVSKQLRQ